MMDRVRLAWRILIGGAVRLGGADEQILAYHRGVWMFCGDPRVMEKVRLDIEWLRSLAGRAESRTARDIAHRYADTLQEQLNDAIHRGHEAARAK